jgi:hypothetical protein
VIWPIRIGSSVIPCLLNSTDRHEYPPKLRPGRLQLRINFFATFKSDVSNPSVNRRYSGASTFFACSGWLCIAYNCARLVAVRNCPESADCCSASARVCNRHRSARAKSESGEVIRIIALMRDSSGIMNRSPFCSTSAMKRGEERNIHAAADRPMRPRKKGKQPIK